MKHGKADSKPRVKKIEPLPIQSMAYSIRAFCAAHAISIDLYFRQQRRGEGPQTMKVGGRTLISIESAAAWRKQRELATQQQQRHEREAAATAST